METTLPQRTHKTRPADARLRRRRVLQLIFAGAATVATLALFNATHPGGAGTVAAPGLVRLADQATELPNGGFAADPSDPWTPQPDPAVSSNPNPGWGSQPDPGWNADPGWDFQPSP
jgi:hypothetical protein